MGFASPAHGWTVCGPRLCGYKAADDRIREELNDRLTAHGFIDATDIECPVQNGEVTLDGFVHSRQTKRAAEDVADGIQGVHDVHNNLRTRDSHGRRAELPYHVRALPAADATP